MADFANKLIALVQAHAEWGVPAVFVLAFLESFALISLIAPATAILLGIGGLIGLSGIAFWPIWFAAACGAIVGDWLAYALAYRFKGQILRTWPLSRKPDLVARGFAFFDRWGILAVFIGRFFGPLRAMVPIVAGVLAMPWLKFQIANVASAFVWATGILAPGALGLRWLKGL